jgi:hypothetical protein
MDLIARDINHLKLTHRVNGLDARLAGVGGHVIED